MKCSEEMRILRSPFVPFSFDKIMKQLSKSQKGHWPPWCLKSQTDVPEDGACMWCAFFKPHAPLFLTSQLPKSQFYILKPENSPSSPLFRGGKTYSYIYIYIWECKSDGLFFYSKGLIYAFKYHGKMGSLSFEMDIQTSSPFLNQCRKPEVFMS